MASFSDCLGVSQGGRGSATGRLLALGGGNQVFVLWCNAGCKQQSVQASFAITMTNSALGADFAIGDETEEVEEDQDGEQPPPQKCCKAAGIVGCAICCDAPNAATCIPAVRLGGGGKPGGGTLIPPQCYCGAGH